MAASALNGVVGYYLPTFFAIPNTRTLAAPIIDCRRHSPILSRPISTYRARPPAGRLQSVRMSGSTRDTGSDLHAFDVVIVGAGIIGLTVARQFLLHSNLSVAVVDAAVPCAGATGAGQGHIWLGSKDPGNEKWELAMRSHQLWDALAETIQSQGQDIGWKKTGSLIVGRTASDCSLLKMKVEQLTSAGLRAEYLSHDDLLSAEPALKVGVDGGAAFAPDDCQLDARRAVEFIEKENRHFVAEGRYAEFYYEPVTALLRNESSGEVEAVQTSQSTLLGKKAVVIAAGCWSGSVIHKLLENSEIEFDFPVKPRKGHLLILENFTPLKLNHGLMEVGYISHASAMQKSTSSDEESGYEANATSVSMTATMDTSGSLVLGSSRQFVGFSTEIDEPIIHEIWERAGEFFPVLKEYSVKDLSKSRAVRVGLRPYMPSGTPVIGPMPGLSKMFIAAGHEGEGLLLALGTAEMVYNMLLENPQAVDPAPYSA